MSGTKIALLTTTTKKINSQEVRMASPTVMADLEPAELNQFYILEKFIEHKIFSLKNGGEVFIGMTELIAALGRNQGPYSVPTVKVWDRLIENFAQYHARELIPKSHESEQIDEPYLVFS